MPKVEIRPAAIADFPALVNIDHGYKTHYVWQMDLHQDEGQTGVTFREIRLPRPVRVEFPRPYQELFTQAGPNSVILIGSCDGTPAGYIHVSTDLAPTTAWVLALAVTEERRRQGIARSLVVAAQDWARMRHLRRMVLEIQSKNLPAIRMAQKLGYEFSGYNDHYYSNQDIALFFSQYLR